jgi:N-acetyl-anhydromuramyl-L-alanine amidase AmpD
MLAKDIPDTETKAHKSFEKNLVERTENGLKIFAFKPTFSTDFFFKEEPKKTGIVLHFTAGFLPGDVRTLTTPHNHVSVSYVVARNGNVYELFSPKNWSFHLGKGTVGGNETCSKQTIGIEISNIGPLFPKGTTLNFKTDQGLFPYCDASETQFFTKLNKPFRDVLHFASYTDPQYAAIKALIDNLTGKFSIPRTFLPLNTRFEPFASNQAGANFKGIASHVNYRKSGKWDIGPAFDWNKIA